MSFDEIIARIRASFFVIFSGCVLASYAMSLIFGFATMYTRNVTAFLVMTVLAELAFFIFYAKRELSRRQLLVRFAIHLLAILGIMLSVAGFMGWISPDQPTTIAVFIGTVVAVYIMVGALGEYQSKKLAERLNQKLKERYKG
jgi:peptidoglycan/LPS O-acetylase OafA/YrhL